MISKNRLWGIGAVVVGILGIVFLAALIRPQQDSAAPSALASATLHPSSTPLPTQAAQTTTPIPGIPSVSGFYTPVPVDGPPTPLPKNGALFFLWGSGLYTAQNDGTGLKHIAEDYGVSHFALAPDGQRIVFAGRLGDRREQDNVYVMNADGSRIIELVNRVGWAPESIRWSPNGEKIAFQSSGTIYVVSISDGSILGVTPGQSNNTPRWSPDSRRIAFLSGASGAEELTLMNVDGSDARSLTPGISPGFFFWVPGGRQIVFKTKAGVDVYVVDTEAQLDLGRLDHTVLYDPRDWSPDGQQVMLAREDGLYKANIDGREETRLVEGAFQLPAFVWSPDGTRIAFSAFREMTTPATFDVYLMNSDGGQFTRILPEAISNSWPRWSPDGRFLLFYSQQEDETLTGVYKLSLADGTTERLPLDNFSLEMVWQPLP